MRHTISSYSETLLDAKMAEKAGDFLRAIRLYTSCIDFLMWGMMRAINDPDLQSVLTARRLLYARRTK